ncbi:MAG TPA: tyrosine-type recombinase/integrase, partial [Nitrospiraceae bacterium]|nr:tyrosine-type recombinase/integrase [Nitrospiraceae bacterium]
MRSTRQCCAPQNREHGIKPATRLIQAGVDVYTVQKLGRWKTISMVLRYAHHQPESLRGGAGARST